MHGGAHAARGARATDSAVASLGIAVVIAAVVPLALLQLAGAIGWATPAMAAAGAGGRDGAASLARSSGLALPVMAAVVPVAALAATRHRAWLLLVAGLSATGIAGLLGENVRSVASMGIDRALHGLGAGIALSATLALGWERVRWRRLLASWWAAVTVAGLAVAAAAIPGRVTAGDWPAALRPHPWLTGAALAAVVAYGAIANRGGPASRKNVTALERAQLALLAGAAAGLSVFAVGIAYQRPAAMLASATIAMVAVYGLAVGASRDAVTGGPLCCPLVFAVAGLVLAPATGPIVSPRFLEVPRDARYAAPWPLLAAAAAASVCGIVVAALARRHGRGVVLGGLSCAAVGLAARYGAARYGAGPFAAAPALAAASISLLGGLAAALAAVLADATAAAALAGLSLMLAGMLTGYLTAWAIQTRMVNPGLAGRASSPAAVRAALVSAAGTWELAAAAAAAVAVIGVFLAGRARRGAAAGHGHG